VNENALRTDGIDIDLRGQLDVPGNGKLTSDLSLTKIFSYKIEFPDGTSEQFAGTQGPYNLSAGAGTPRYRATWSNNYGVGPFSTTLTAYYVSGFREVGVDATGDPNACLYNDAYCHVASFINLVVTSVYHLDKHLTASLVVQNLMDRCPPIDPASFSGLNYNPTYHQSGMIGRYFKLGIGYKF
jgi:iron complex outermembrane receptor protein